MAKNHEMYTFFGQTWSFLYVKRFILFNRSKIRKNLLFYIKYFILIYSLFISLKINNKFILFADGSALVHLLLNSLLQL